MASATRLRWGHPWSSFLVSAAANWKLAWPVIECFADNLRLLYDSKTGLTKNNDGVDVRVPGFGGTSTIEYLDWLGSPLSSYFAPIVKKLVASGAYVRGKNLHGAPYDFRKGPSEMSAYFENLTRLVENTYADNNSSQVSIVAHSMGCPLTLLWLNGRPLSWRRKYIRWFIPIAGAWAGSLKALRLIVSGDNINLFTVNPLYLRPLQRSSPSSLFLLPSALEWSADEVVLESPFRNYTVNDYKDLFNDIRYAEAIEIWKREKSFYDGLRPPNVPVYAIYGNNISTPAMFRYTLGGQQWTEKQPVAVLEKTGDGTVNERSLRVVKKWNQKENLTIVELDKAEHLAILNDRRVIDTIMELVRG